MRQIYLSQDFSEALMNKCSRWLSKGKGWEGWQMYDIQHCPPAGWLATLLSNTIQFWAQQNDISWPFKVSCKLLKLWLFNHECQEFTVLGKHAEINLRVREYKWIEKSFLLL